MKVNDKATVKIVAIVCLTVLEIANFLTMKIDSTMTALVFSLISGLAGYEFGRRRG